MRDFLRFLLRPGVFIAVVGIFVLAAAAVLWQGMSVPSRHLAFERKKPVGRAAFSAALPESSKPDPVITRARLCMANFGFEKVHDARMEAVVKQVDHALLQAMLRCNLPLEEAVAEKTELRHKNTGQYLFQRIRLTVGEDPLPFITSLREALNTWAEGAEVVRAGSGPEALWTINAKGAVTHELVLTSAPHSSPVPETAGKSGGIPGNRLSGEPARFAIVIDDMGEDVSAVRTLARLPFPVTIAVLPRSSRARKVAETGHLAGLEILVHQPAEPRNYPKANPGPNALLVSLPDQEIEARVRDSLTRVPYAVGMNNHMGSRFTSDKRAAAAMLRPLRERGFFALDSLTYPGSVLYAEAARQGIPALRRDVFLDAAPGKAYALRQLQKAEKIALEKGRAVAIGHPFPDTLAALKEWGAMRNAQVELVRLSDLLFTKE